MSEILQIAATIIAAVGASGGIIAGISGWLGRIWASRLMEADRARHSQELEQLRASLKSEQDQRMKQLQNDLDIFREKHLKAHQDKIATYRMAAAIIASILTDIERFGEGRADKQEAPKIKDRFTNDRIRLYGYLAMLAPQSVMDAQDALVDHVLMIIHGREAYKWDKIRELGLTFLNEVRKDIGIDSTPIEYKGIL